MKTKFIFALVLLCAAVAANAQPTAKFLEEKKDFSSETAKKEEKSLKQTSAETKLPSVQTNSNQTTTTYTRPNAEKRFRRYLMSVGGPFSLMGSAIGAGIGTASNAPEEWGKKPEGFGRRFASNVGRNAISNTTIYALDEAFKLDSHFYRSEKRDAGSRIKNALLSTVTARRPNGKRTVGVPRIVGTYTGAIIASETWFPKRFSYKDGFRDGTISLGINSMVNLIREFIWKK